MRICFIGPANSTHIIKWCNWFYNEGHEVHLITFVPGIIKGTKIHLINLNVNSNGSEIGKLKYLTTGRRIKLLVKKIQPDIVSAHYATSYGVAVALSGIKKYVLSVWGSDIYDFPKKTPIHRALLKYSLWKAPYLFSTSNAMAREASKYTKKLFEITPFGVDMELFNPNKRTRPHDQSPFIIGTVKALSDLYGIDFILKAVSLIRKENNDIDLRVRISGDGPDSEKYMKMAKELDISDITEFLGRISQSQAASEWANMDVAIIPSVLYESFGVAAVEAQACETPVIISDVDGLKETTLPEKSSIVVEKKNEREIANAIISLFHNPELRIEMGKNGRRFVYDNFEIQKTFEKIEKLLESISMGEKKPVL